MSVLKALARHYERLHASGEAPPYGFSRERISFAVVLSDAGEAVAVSPSTARGHPASAAKRWANEAPRLQCPRESDPAPVLRRGELRSPRLRVGFSWNGKRQGPPQHRRFSFNTPSKSCGYGLA